ncbi:MAG: hypothetical protein NTZ56_18610 [Acidobacteria bacterium]|nr:hypothetical protein [Acidobacteriota bacterium]
MSRSHSGNPFPPAIGRVLLIEDHPVLRQLLSDLLAQEGYEVECTTGPIPSGPFDLLLTDWLVPGLEIASLVESLLTSGAAAICVVMSGYPVSLDQFPAALRQRLGFLAKPFSARQLAECLHGLQAQHLLGGQVR